MEALRGKKIKSFIRPDILADFTGKLKIMKESEIRRLVVKLLIMKVLKEQFVTQKFRGNDVN